MFLNIRHIYSGEIKKNIKLCGLCFFYRFLYKILVMTYNQITKSFKLFETKKILIVGDVMIDSYIIGTVERISPEAPVPVVSIKKTNSRPGGAANVALNIKSMGGNPVICSVIGDDEKGELLLRLLEKNKIKHNGIVIEKNRPTTCKTRVISNNQHLLRIDEETDVYISGNTEKKLFEKYTDILNSEKPDAVIFQDYNKGVLTTLFIEKAIDEANIRGVEIFVDPKKQNFSIYKNVSLFKPNFKEFTEGLNIDIKKFETEKIFEASKKLQKMLNTKKVLITLSEAGIFISDGNKYHHIKSETKDIIDVSGAGDTVIAVTSLCMVSGVDIETTAILSDLAGGLVCEKPGVVPVEKEELLKKYLTTK